MQSKLKSITSSGVVNRIGDLFSIPSALYSIMLLDLVILTIVNFKNTYAVLGAIVIAKLALVIIAFLAGVAVTLFANRAWNFTLFLSFTLVLVVGQLVLVPKRLSRFPAETTRYPVPYMMFTGQPNADDHNYLGYRGEAPPEDKIGEYRVFMIGGSTVYGIGPIDQTLPSYLESAAHAQGDTEVQVYNWGVASQLSGMEVSSILHRVVDHDPDLVIFYDGGNDVYHPYWWDPRPGYPFNFVVYERIPYITQYGDFPALNAMILSNIYIVRAFFQLELEASLAPVEPLRKEVGYGTVEWERSIVENYLNNLDHACHLAKGFDFQLVVFLQPIRPLSETPQTDFETYLVKQYGSLSQGIAELSNRYAGDDTCMFYDMSDICSDIDCTFIDEIHVDFQTREVIATELYSLLQAGGIR